MVAMARTNSSILNARHCSLVRAQLFHRLCDLLLHVRRPSVPHRPVVHEHAEQVNVTLHAEQLRFESSRSVFGGVVCEQLLFDAPTGVASGYVRKQVGYVHRAKCRVVALNVVECLRQSCCALHSSVVGGDVHRFCAMLGKCLDNERRVTG